MAEEVKSRFSLASRRIDMEKNREQLNTQQKDLIRPFEDLLD